MDRAPPRKGQFWVLGELTRSRAQRPALPLLGALSWRRPHLKDRRPTVLSFKGRLGRAPHLVSERWLELADIQGADQRDAVHGTPIPRACLSGEAAVQLHHGGRHPLSCPEADTESLAAEQMPTSAAH